MSKHLGDFDTSTVVYGKFTTFRPSTGAAYTLGGTPALSVYKDNSTTQSTTGVTLTADFDSVTGLNHFAIDTSADGTFYSSGSFFDVVITTGTVDSVSVVGAVVGSFTLRKTSALKPATAGRTLVVDSAGLADANVVKLGPTGSGTAQTARDIGASVLLSSGTGTGQLNFTSGVVDANTTKVSGTSQTAKDLGAINVTNLNTLSGHDPGATLGTSTLTQTQVTGGAYAINSASFAFNSALDLTTTQKASVNAEVDSALDTAIPGTPTANSVNERILTMDNNLPADPADASDISTSFSGVTTTLSSMISTLATISGYIDTEVAAIKAKTDNLPASPAATGDIPSASTIASAVWNESQSGHTTAGTFGKYLDSAVSGVSTGGVSAADIADAVWDEVRSPGHTTSGTFGKYLDAQVSSVSGGGSTVDATNVDREHTWKFDSPNQTTAPNIIGEIIGFIGLLSMDLSEPLPTRSAISSISSVTFTNISGTEPTVTSYALTTDNKGVNVLIDATSATANTYTINVTVVTTDSQTFVRKGRLTLTA